MSSKNIEEIEEYILNISSYEAKMEITVNSNKNTNKYVLLRQYIEPNLSKQVVLEPSNLEGLEIEYDGHKLTLNNTKLNLVKIYEDYQYIIDNYLTLESFINDYKNGIGNNTSKVYEENGEVVLEVMPDANKYIKKLCISKNTLAPTKLMIENINQKTLVYILYNEIKINDLEIIAFKEINEIKEYT